MVVNHGVLEPLKRLANSTVEEWKKHYDVNVFSGLGLVSPFPHVLPSGALTPPQLKEAIPALRKSKGCVVWVSSGAATSPYAAWGAYGSSKAAAHSVTTHLAVEEPDITAVSISPGRVDTDMQKLIREVGDEMNQEERRTFSDAFTKGELGTPEGVAVTYARFVVEPRRELSGKLVKYVGPPLSCGVQELTEAGYRGRSWHRTAVRRKQKSRCTLDMLAESRKDFETSKRVDRW